MRYQREKELILGIKKIIRFVVKLLKVSPPQISSLS